MAKILLVEDDNNLREIYEARLQAEGYDIVSARDGEEALTVAMKEHPDLIISDVMMPKISGFDMLDIIRSTEETKNVKVIMMTALSQAEDKERATKLGADRYLVKSQVTLEDVAKVAREVLEGAPAQSQPAPEVPATMQEPVVSEPAVVPTVAAPVEPEEAPSVAAPVEPAVVAPTVTLAPSEPVVSEPVVATPATAAPTPTEPAATVATPTTDPVAPAVAPTTDNPALSAIAPATDDADENANGDASDEESAIAAQIESFIDAKKNSTEENLVAPAPEIKAEPTQQPVVEETPEETTTPEPVRENPEKTLKKVITPINDPTASKGPDLENLLKKEAEKEEMAQIAKSVAEKKADVADELSAEAALRSAARDPKTPPEEALPDDAPQVNITENGELKVKTPPEETPLPEEPEAEAVDTSDVPKVDAPKPVIPHQNGSSLDGVVPQAPTAPAASTPIAPAAPAVPTPPATDNIDPNSISL